MKALVSRACRDVYVGVLRAATRERQNPSLTVVVVVVAPVFLVLPVFLAHLPLQEAEGHEKHAQAPTAESPGPHVAAPYPRACHPKEGSEGEIVIVRLRICQLRSIVLLLRSTR